MTKSSSRGPAQSPARQYLSSIRKRLAAARKDTPILIEMGERMGRSLLAGGNIFAPAVTRWWPSEFTGRAGGLMAVRGIKSTPVNKNDVCLTALPDVRRWDAAEDERFQRLVKSKRQIYVIGRQDELEGVGGRGRFAGFTGGARRDEGLYGLGQYRPFAPLRYFDDFVRGWIAVGEMVAACIRGGKMPVLWMSVWLEGSTVRNASMTTLNNLREPWLPPLFHEDRYIPPLAPGYAAGEFITAIEGILDVLETQLDQLATAGRWLAETHRAGGRIWANLVGHSFPQILDLPEDGMPKIVDGEKELYDGLKARHDYPLKWGGCVSDIGRAVPKAFGKGDMALHLGYGPVNVPAVDAYMKRGIRIVHTTPYGRAPGMKDHRNFLWFDLPWRPTDAIVDIPGYGVRMMPSSSSAEAMAYFAIMSEMAERMGWK